MAAFNKVVIFGVGLIGGSFALALKRADGVKHIVGVGRRQATLERALSLGIIDSIGDVTSVVDADLVLIAAPVAQTQALLAAIEPHLGPTTVVTDAGSTKTDVVTVAHQVLGAKISQFVPAHPIAGREQNGPDAALVDLYVGKKLVITALPENTAQDIERVAAAWQQCGAIVHRLSAEAHDAVFAAVSHLPHLLAYALVDEVAGRDDADLLFQYAASGFRDFTRIAGSSPEMWRDISLANRQALLSEIDAYQTKLGQLRAGLAQADGAAIQALFQRAQAARQGWIASIEAAEPMPLPDQGGE